MNISTLARLAAKHVRNEFAEELYIRTRHDTTRPVTVYGIVNERCNYKCRYCEYWRLPKYVDEMTIEDWQNALSSLKEFVGPFHVEFSGGEPYIKKGFPDLCTWCHRNGIKWGVTTNGSALNEKNIRQLIDARPFNVNMSMDSHVAEIHDYARGIEGSLQKISKNIQDLIAERNAQGLDFPVIIKPVVHRLNYRYLPGMVDWVKELGATAIHMQPVDRWTQETYDELWIEEAELPQLMEVSKELIRRKRAGDPILNSELLLSIWDKHFRNETAPEEVLPCRVGMRNYFIRTNGDVEVCWHFPPIGNVKKQSARDIWYSELAAERRKQTVECTKLCLYTCLSQKTVLDKVKMGLTLIGGNRGRNKGNTGAPKPIEVQHRSPVPLASDPASDAR
jgi:MoaA/NifB/PqqE/SkfB family radical SAM enzyme